VLAHRGEGLSDIALTTQQLGIDPEQASNTTCCVACLFWLTIARS
jgi:hypothetical protein